VTLFVPADVRNVVIWRSDDTGVPISVYSILTIHTINRLSSPRSTVQLTLSQPVKKFPALYGTRRFITVFTTAHHLALFWARSIQSTLSCFIRLSFILLNPSTLGFSQYFRLSHQHPVWTSLTAPTAPTVRAICLAFVILLNFITLIMVS